MEFKQQEYSYLMENIKQIKLSNSKNENIIRIGFDPVENKKYYQYRFNIKNNDNFLYFKYYINNVISQVYINDQEYLGFYKINILEDLIKNNFKKINTEKYIIK